MDDFNNCKALIAWKKAQFIGDLSLFTFETLVQLRIIVHQYYVYIPTPHRCTLIYGCDKKIFFPFNYHHHHH